MLWGCRHRLWLWFAGSHPASPRFSWTETAVTHVSERRLNISLWVGGVTPGRSRGYASLEVLLQIGKHGQSSCLASECDWVYFSSCCASDLLCGTWSVGSLSVPGETLWWPLTQPSSAVCLDAFSTLFYRVALPFLRSVGRVAELLGSYFFHSAGRVLKREALHPTLEDLTHGGCCLEQGLVSRKPWRLLLDPTLMSILFWVLI